MSKYGDIAADQGLLILGLKNREQEALRTLYENYSGALNGIIYRIVGDDVISEEVLQDVIIKIWDKINSYDSTKGRLFTWMMQIARNSALDKVRSKEISQRNKTDQLDNIVSKVERANPVISYIPDVGMKKVLDTLRVEERTVIDLVYFKGFSQSEVAKHTSIPLGTVKTRLRMALKNLRKLLE